MPLWADGHRWKINQLQCSKLQSTQTRSTEIYLESDVQIAKHISLSCSNYLRLYLYIDTDCRFFLKQTTAGREWQYDDGIITDPCKTISFVIKGLVMRFENENLNCIILQLFCPRWKNNVRNSDPAPRHVSPIDYHYWNYHLFILLEQQVSEIVFKLSPTQHHLPLLLISLRAAAAGGLHRNQDGQHFLSQLFLVSCPTRWSLYLPLALCGDILSTERRGTAMY